MPVGDRLFVLTSPTSGAPYAIYEITSETVDATGYLQAAMLVKQVDDAGATVAPGVTTIADGADVTQGAKADSAAATDTGTFSLIALVKRGLQSLTAIAGLLGGTGTIKDGGPSWTSVWGVSNAPVSSADMSGADADLTAAPTSGQKWVITDVFVSADTAMRIDIKEETSGTVMFSGYVAANSGFQQLCPRGKRKLAVVDKKVVGRTSAAGNVRILVGAYSEL